MTSTKPPDDVGTETTTATPSQTELHERLEALVGQVVTDAGAFVTVPLALLGDRLELFTALTETGPVTSAELAEHTGLRERYVREWLMAMATAGYVSFDGAETGSAGTVRYHLAPEQAEAFTNPDSPGYVAGVFQSLTAGTRMLDRLTEAFRTGEGVGWHEHHEDLFLGTERFFRPGYLTNLTSSWIPALTGIEEKLLAGARVADIGCGLGASTVLMARAYPESTFVGLDYHDPSIELARQRAADADVGDRITFRTAGANELEGTYDLIGFFDCLHDMPDPMSALRAARSSLAEGGSVMLVEPMSWDQLSESVNPLGRLLAGVSMLVCLPSGLSQTPAYGLGNQVGPSRMRELAHEAGFGSAEVATSGEVNLIYELRA